MVSESGKNVKEYRIKLTKEKVIDGKLVAPAQYDLPSLEVVDKELNFQTLEQKDDTLLEGEVRLLQEGKVGKERIFTLINPDGSKEEKFREVIQTPTDRIVLVGTKTGTAIPEDEVKNLVLKQPKLIIEEETIDFKVEERKSDKLYLGETRILQEGRQGIRVHLIEVENGKRTEKESYDKVIAQDRIVEVGTAGETTKPVAQEAKKPQVSEKADTKQIASSEADQANKVQLPNTGSTASQAAVAAGLALLGLSAGLVATKGKKED